MKNRVPNWMSVPSPAHTVPLTMLSNEPRLMPRTMDQSPPPMKPDAEHAFHARMPAESAKPAQKPGVRKIGASADEPCSGSSDSGSFASGKINFSRSDQ